MISANLISLALLAGILAAFNPCGFVLLPAYLMHFIASESISERRSLIYFKAFRFSLGMTLGFIGVFGGFALFIASMAGSVERYLPIITILVGLSLIAWSIALLLGKNILLRKLANPNIAPTEKWHSQIGYGVTFALTSLSCTIGPFLAITATAIQGRDVLRSLTLFMAYALGMGMVVLTLALALAATRSTLVRRIQGSQRGISIFSGALLLIVGFYETWYGWFEIRTLRGGVVSDPVISFAVSIQSGITQNLVKVGATTLVLLSTFLISLILFVAYLFKRTKVSSG